MVTLLRLATRSAWTGCDSSGLGPADRQRAIDNLKLRPDEEGLSLWELAKPGELELVAAAVACQRRRVQNVDYIKIDSGIVSSLARSLSVRETPQSPKQTNFIRELLCSGIQAHLLAERLLELQTRAERIGQGKIKELLLGLGPEDVTDPATKEWLLTLARGPLRDA